MPTIFSHAAIPIAISLGSRKISRRLLLVGVAASIIPDLDVIAFRLGFAYSHEFGHRGFSHSLLFAFSLGVVAALFSPELRTRRRTAFLFTFAVTASHGLLDMFTNGGLGVALFWPLSDTRYFFPVRPIEVSPIGLHNFMSLNGLRAIKSELLWIWCPAVVWVLVAYLRRAVR